MWTCPICKKKFKRAHQAHSCATVDIDDHFVRSDPKIRDIFYLLEGHINKFGHVRMNSVHSSIQFLSATTFLSVRVWKNSLNLEFFLKEPHDLFLFYKVTPFSKNRIVHCMRIENKRDITKQLIRWLKESYEIVNNSDR